MASFSAPRVLDDPPRGRLRARDAYRARREGLGRDFALQVILPGQASPDAISRFRREARLASGLAGNPGIVGVHDVGEADGNVYFAMDLVEGTSLETMIERGGLTPLSAAELIEKAARAVAFAHSRGILHRDLKPANILVDASGEPHVTDFGLAAAREAGPEASRLTKSGAVLGTPAYMSPEQAKGEGLDARADVWSLEATLYECLVGETPFSGDTVYAILARILREDPRPPRRRDPRIPRDLDTIALKCLEKAPERRYPTAEALAADLERWRKGEAIAARPVGRLERFGKHVRRNRVPWTVAAAAGVVLAGVLGFFGVRAARDRVAVAGQMQTAEALIETAPEKALGMFEQIGARAGAAYPGLQAVRARAEAQVAVVRLAKLREQAGPLLETGDQAAAAHATALAEVERLEAADTERRLKGEAGAAAAPEAGEAGLGGPGADPAAGAVPARPEADDTTARELAEARRALDDAYVVAKEAYGSAARVLDPARSEAGWRRVWEARADLAWARLRHAEGTGRRDDATRFGADMDAADATLAAPGGAKYARERDDAGTLTLDTVPTGADAECRRYREGQDPSTGLGAGGRLEDVPFDPRTGAFAEAPVTLGRTPLARVALPMGSYVLILRAPGFRDVRYPILVERNEEECPRAPIPLLTEAQIGEGFVYVPPGESILGADEKAYQS